MIIIVLGKSCAGKTTFVNHLKLKYGLCTIKQYTTRSRRNEFDNEYIFVDNERFLQINMINVKKYDGNLYGVSYQSINSINEDAILITDILTALKIRKLANTKIIYIKSTLVDRLKRLKKDKRNLFRIIIDFLYTFDFIFADIIIKNHGKKEEFLYESEKHINKILQSSETFNIYNYRE